MVCCDSWACKESDTNDRVNWTELRRRQWQPTPVLLPGKSHGCRSLVGCSPWGRKEPTRLSAFTFTFHFPALEKEMATHSSVLAWRIPGTGEPGGLPSMGSHRVGHDWSDLAAGKKNGNSDKLYFLGSKIIADGDCSLEIKRRLLFGRKAVRKQRYHFADKGLSSQSYGFSNSHEWMWELDNKESWVLKNWCFQTVVLEKTLESPSGSKEIEPVSPKGNQPWILIGRTDAEAEASILWPPDVKSQLTGNDPDVGEDWGQEEKGATGDELVGWYHRLNGQEFEQTVGDGEEQGGLGCCHPWGHKESDTTEQLNNKKMVRCR